MPEEEFFKHVQKKHFRTVARATTKIGFSFSLKYVPEELEWANNLLVSIINQSDDTPLKKYLVDDTHNRPQMLKVPINATGVVVLQDAVDLFRLIPTLHKSLKESDAFWNRSKAIRAICI